MKKQIGFTLSEIILVLAIMGTLLALTLPNLMNRTNNAAYVAGLQKIYGMLDTATSQIMLKNAGTTINAFGATAEECRAKYGEYLDFYKTCNSSIEGNCWASTTKTLSGGTTILSFKPASCSAAILADGTFLSFCINGSLSSCNGTGLSANAYTGIGSGILCGTIFADVNGFKAPNTIGRDIFMFMVGQNGLFPAGDYRTMYNDWTVHCNKTVTTQDGVGCAGKVLNEVKMNY